MLRSTCIMTAAASEHIFLKMSVRLNITLARETDAATAPPHANIFIWPLVHDLLAL